MKEYLQQVLDSGAFVAVEVHPSEIVTAPWVVMKCRYGCPRYGHNRSCPPFAPGWQETRVILESYRRAIIFGVRSMSAGTPLALKLMRALGQGGYYRAIGFDRPLHQLRGVQACRLPSSGRSAAVARGLRHRRGRHREACGPAHRCTSAPRRAYGVLRHSFG